MRFLPTSAVIKSPLKSLYLVDIALLLSIIPHLDKLKFPMLVYLAAAFFVLAAKRNVSKTVQYVFMAFGLLSVISSFYTDFNFTSFGRFVLFISLLNALLVYAVVLQRLKGELNFYLSFSPALLLMLSFFLHNSVFMLFYMVFTLFVFLLLLVWAKMGTPLYDALKLSLSIFAFSLPVVALLFMVFPRISFEKADYGFRDELVKRSGHNGVMSLGSDALLVPSAQIVMEVYFDKMPPQNSDLYFRGTTLYVDSGNAFRQLIEREKRPLAADNSAVSLQESAGYKVTLYPHNEKWLYALDIPAFAPAKSTLFDDYTIQSKAKIEKILRYPMRSYLSYRMNAPLREAIEEASLQADEQRDKRSARIAKQLTASSDTQTLENLVGYFQSLDLTYTLQPGPLDKKTPIDSFLQGSKKGYCVHFAAAFTYMARIAGLPSRIVTGYLINSEEALNNYLVVRANSAHAWVEVYLKGQGWTRVETTAFAKHMESNALPALNNGKRSAMEAFLKRANLRLLYLKYVIETWILEYSRVKQMELLHNLLNNTVYLVKFIFYTLLFIAFSIFLAFYINARRCRDRLLCLMAPLLKRAKKAGYEKNSQESMHDFLTRLKARYDEGSVDEIDALYHTIKYAKRHDNGDIVRLKELIKEINR
jgi:hypothetical protein